MALASKVAVNPLPWVLGPDGFDLSPTTVRAAVAGIADAGFTAMHSDVPEQWSAAEYRAVLADHGVRPAPGYFGAYFDVPVDELPALVEAAKAHAGVQLELGLSEVFLASHLSPERIASPAVGADFDASRLELVIERIALVAGAITAEGLTPCFHPHVGSWIETEHEVRAMLDTIDASVLSFGPDTGHLFWGGSDPAALVGDYADRVGAVHLKDVHRVAAATARDQQDDYMAATTVEHVWTEPGRGDVDFEAVFAALPATYDGWFVVEVDVPDLPSKEESTAASFRWITEQPEQAGSA
ncbi:sugar phosphate isomerase/epimerase family protein [Angustibacter sp. McL0619]|uniref:sugar phosphate isomerase/epimerase family protein n=1 Tax=Angustibacter sp. McL0619 TaxID=3415676 RepID=UPI003CE79ED1